ncbi:hypothetical protein [Ferruginibacter sp.]
MRLSRPPSIILSVITIGAIEDTYITFTKEKAATDTKVISVIFCVLLLGLTIVLWLRKNRNNVN